MSDLEKLQLIEEVMELDEGTLAPEDALDDYDEWDSLAVLSFISLADMRCKKRISIDALKNVESVQDVMKLLD